MSVRAVAVDRAPRSDGTDRRPRDTPLGWEIRLGLLALTMLAALALYGPLVAPHDFSYARSLVGGKVPPYAPSEAFPLGSDESGHDLLSWFLIGARTTLGIAASTALLRLAIGATMGIAGTWRGGLFDGFTTRLALAFSSIPATAAAILAVLALDIRTGPAAVVLALSLVGWGDAFHHARRAVRHVASQPFVGAARALGARDTRVLLHHVLPNIAPSLVTSAALQLSAVLITLGEIGLLRLFIGGGISEIDNFGRITVMPSQPDWTSMLAGTRPIITLYNTPWLVLVPGTALLAAVVGTGLLADGLARRALELDIFRLFSRRQLVALLLGLVVVVGPIFVWPSRLAAELTYADAFDPALAAQVARELQRPEMGGRVVGSDGARAAAQLVAARTGGNAIPIRTTLVVPRAARLSIREGRVDLGADLEPLSLTNGAATGPLVLLQPDGLQGQPADPANAPLHGAIAVLDRPSAYSFVAHVAPQFGVTGIVVLSDEADTYPASASAFDVPIVRVDRSRFATLLGRTPSPRGAITPLGSSAALEISVGTQDIAEDAIVVRIAGLTSGGPLIVITTSYDDAVYAESGDRWRSAAAAGVLVAAVERLRDAQLPADILVLATPGGGVRYAGLAAALEQLPADERARIAAVITIDATAARTPAIRATLADASTPTPLLAVRAIAPRVADALGVAVRALAASLEQVLATAGPRTAYQVVSWTNERDEPSSRDYRSAGQMLMTLVAYIARHDGDVR
jgi:peptide/nickel transport system permease protein